MRIVRRSLLARALVVVWLLWPSVASALADGVAPAVVVRETVFGSARAVGNTLMVDDGTTNTALLPGGSQATVRASEIPPDGTIVRAFLFWSGSTDPVFGVDRDVDFRMPDGTFFNDLSVDFPAPGEPPSSLNRCVQRDGVGDTPVSFFACRREVTQLVQRLGPGGATGTYEVSDVAALPGDCFTNQFCQAMYAGWALIVMWESPTHPVRRDLVLYDAFFAVDEQGPPFSSGISPEFRLDGFLVGPTADAELTFMGFEGDGQLGTPNQSLLPPGHPQFCTTCDDFIDLRRAASSTRVRLSDATNPPGNLFNGSNNAGGGTHPGLDIDTFDVGASGLGALQSNDNALFLRAGSGDGAPGGGGGGGELVFLGFTLLALDTFSPRFSNDVTEKVVLEPVAGVGEQLNYILRVENDGSASATGVVLRDQLPAGVTYLPGSTTNTCGVSSADAGGTSPVLRPQGLNIGTLTVGERCEVRFKVTVNGDVADGTVLRNFFTVAAANHPSLQVGPATTIIEGARIGQPEKTVNVVGGGPATAGSTLVYTLRVPNEGSRSAPQVRVLDALPAELEFQGFVGSLPPGSTNNTDPAAGVIDVSNITVPAGGSVEISFFARIRPGTASGASISNQATVEQPSLPAPLVTDDPSTNAQRDATVIVVESDIDLSSSSKTVTDVDGAPAVPGDVLEYRVRVRQLGTEFTTVLVSDDLPPFVGGCTVVSLPPGAVGGCQSGGANGTGRLEVVVPVPAGQTRDVVFRVTVAASAPDGSVIVNQAELSPFEDPTAAETVTSPAFEVFARPLFLSSTKSVVDLDGGDVRPGDRLRYTITVRNSGPVAASNLVVTDVVNGNLEAIAPQDGGVLSGSTVTWTSASLASGAEATFSFEATVRAALPNATRIGNRATIDADAPADPFTTPEVSVSVRAEPLLVVQKTVADVGPAPFEPGDVVEYRVLVENQGDGVATFVEVRDPIDPGLESVSLPAGGRIEGVEVVFDQATTPELAAVAPGDAVTLVFQARIRTPLPNGTEISNQASVNAAEIGAPAISDDPTTAAPNDPTDLVVSSQAALAVTKRFVDLNDGALLPGDRVEFLLEVSNTGNAPATDVEVRDPLDARLTFVSSSTGGTFAGGLVRFTRTSAPGLASVLPGAPVTLRFVAQVAAPLANGTVIENQASASSPVAATVPSDDPTTAAALDPTRLVVESRPILDGFSKAVVDLDGDGVFEPRDRVRYTLVVENTGSEPATNVAVTDPVPAELVNIVVGEGGQLAGGQVTWTAATTPALASVAVGARVTLSFEGDVRRPLANQTVVSNQASLSASGIAALPSDDPATADPDDPTRFVVTSHPRLVIEKTVLDLNGPPVEPTDRLRYQLRLRNDGDRAATGVQVTDAIDPSLTAVVPLDGGAIAGGALAWSAAGNAALASIAVDGEVILRFEAEVRSPLDNGTLIDNQAAAGLAEPGVPGGPFPSDDPATPAPLDPTRVQVVSASDLSVSTLESFDGAGNVVSERRPGERVDYVLTVQNGGREIARNVVARVPLPAVLVVDAAPGGVVAGGEVTFTSGGVPDLAAVAPGDVVTLRVQARLVTPLDNALAIDVQALLDEDGLVAPVVSDDPSTTAFGDPTRVTVVSAADLTSFAKRFVDVNGAPAEPGDLIDYILRLENAGDAIARNVVVDDPLAAALELVASDTGGRLVGNRVVFDRASNPALAEIIPGTPVELRFRVRVRTTVTAGALVENQAQVSATGTPAHPSDDPDTAAPDDPTAFEVFTVPRVTLTKDLATPSGTRIVAPEEILTYTFVALSSGSALVGPTVFEDVVPAGLDQLQPGPGLAFDPLTRRLSASLPPLAPGASRTFTLTARVAPGTPNGTRIENQAKVIGADVGTVLSDDPSTPADGDATLAVVEAHPDLSTSTKVAIDLDGAPLLPGDRLRYTIVVTNSGNGAAEDVSVRDAVDTARLAVVSVDDGGQVAGGNVLWEPGGTPALASLPPGASLSLDIVVEVLGDVPDGTAIDNQALIQGSNLDGQVPSDDPSTAAVDDPTRVTVRAPVLSFQKVLVDQTAPSNVLRPGDDVRYEITLENSGSVAATDVVVRDPISDVLVDVVPRSGGALASGEITWSSAGTPVLASVAAGQRVTLRFEATVDPLALGGTLLENQATLTAREVPLPIASDDPATAEARDPTRKLVEAEEDFTGSVELFDDESGAPITGFVVPEQRVRARISFRNQGTQTGRGGVLVVPFNPARFDLEEADSFGIVDRAAGQARWDASQNEAFRLLEPGESITVEVVGRIATPIPDQVTIDVEGRLRTLTSDELWVFGPATLRVRSRPDLTVSTKEVTDDNGGQVEPGDTLTYRITVINDGGAEAREVRVIDPAPPGTVYLSGSTTVGGAPIVDDGATSPLAGGLDIGDVEAGRSRVVTFQVRVSLDALHGLSIPNQAVLRAAGAPDAVTDNPATPLVFGDPTVVVVGGGPHLVVSKVADAAPAVPGERLRFTVAIENAGNDAARDLVLSDLIQRPASYAPGTVTVDGAPKTDAEDGDEVVVLPGSPARLSLRRDVLEAGEGFTVTFEVDVGVGQQILNQAFVESGDLGIVASDGDPSLPGAQATLVPIVGERSIVVDSDSVVLEDGNGGALEAGDPLGGRAVLKNRSLEPIVVDALRINVSALFDIDPLALAPELVWDEGARTVGLAAGERVEVEPGDAVTFAFAGRVSPQAQRGDPVRALAEANVATLDGALAATKDLGRAELVVGLIPGTGALEGNLFFESKERNGAFDPGVDERAVGFTLLARRLGAAPDDPPVRTAVTDESGRFRLLSLPAGSYEVEVLSSSGARFLLHRLDGLEGGELREEDIRIDPSGAVYNSGTFDAVAGARAILFFDDGDEDPANDEQVPAEQLGPGQQGQLTTRQGLYRFDAPPGDYRIGIEAPDAFLIFPSTRIEPVRDDLSGHPLGAVAAPAEDGTIVPQGLPSEALDRTYFLRFHLEPDLPPVLNNHIPLDRLRDQLRITKTANRRRLSVGDLVAYTVRIDNRSEGEILLEDGGVEIVDALPEAFRLVDNAWRLDRIEVDERGQQRRQEEAGARADGSSLVRVGPFSLRAHASYELRYQVVVGPGAPIGEAENRAVLRTAEGQINVTEVASARVRVVPDSLFDLGTVRAKVFCDDDGDGVQSPGELGLGGARVYLDTGHFADADLSGKLHFTLVPPGMHLLKLDERTLPPGTELTEGPRRSLHLSAGLPSQAAFPARCKGERVGPVEVVVNRDAYAPLGEARAPTRVVDIEGTLPDARVFLDGVEMATVRADLGVGVEGEDPTYGQAPGPNLPALSDGVLDKRLLFAPRVESARRILAWQLTIQRELPRRSDVDAGLPSGVAASDAGVAPAPATGANAIDAGVVEGGAADAGAAPSEGGPSEGGPSEGGPSLVAVVAEPVYVFTGRGAPPARVFWDGRDAEGGRQLLEDGQRYAAVLSVTVEGGDEGFSAARPLGVAYGPPVAGEAPAGEPFEVRIDAALGELFTRDGKPTRRLRAFVAETAPRLQEQKGRVFVHAHLDARPDEATQATTARQAQEVASLLEKAGVDEGRITAVGEGDKKPRRPNLRAKDRALNRRVELRVVLDAVRYAPLAPFGWPARVQVNGEPLPVPDGVTFKQAFEARVGEVLVIDATAQGGGRVRLLRRVTDGPFDPAGGSDLTLLRTTRIEGDLSRGVARFAGREVSLDLLDVALEPEAALFDGAGALLLDADGAPAGAFRARYASSRDWVRWTLRIMKPMETAPSASDTDAGAAVPVAADAGSSDAGSPDAGSSDGGSSDGDASPAATPAKEQEPRYTIVRAITGSGSAPERLEWDGRDAEGKPAGGEGARWVARLILEGATGDVAISPDLPLRAVRRAPQPGAVPAASAAAGEQPFALIEDAEADAGGLKPAAAQRLDALGQQLASTSGAIRVEAHTDDSGPRLLHRTRTQRVAEEARKRLLAAGVDEGRLTGLGMGSDRPRMPNLNPRMRARNRRVEVYLEAPAPVVTAAKPAGAQVIANGRELSIEGDRFAGEVPETTSGEVALLLRTSTGARAMVRLRPEGAALWQGVPEKLDDAVTALLAEEASSPAAKTDAGAADAGAADAGAADAGAGDAGHRSRDAGNGDAGEDGASLVAAAIDAGAPAGDAGASQAVALAPFSEEGEPPAWWPALSDVGAADLVVELPPEGEKLTSSRLLVRGRTHPKNQVQINAADVKVDAATGEFAQVVSLPEGNSELLVEAIDPVGNRARVRRLVAVDTAGWFALLLADTAFGGDGARLHERTPYTSLTLGDVFVYGRGVAYVKGRFAGGWLFKDYDLTLHVDTRRWEEDAFARDLANPDLVYPVYGDSSLEVQEAQARYPLYLELKADASALRVGNLRTGIAGGDLFRYDRARYGAMLSFDRGWAQGLDVEKVEGPLAPPAADPWRTRATAFVTGGAQSQRHARVELLGTGGAVYFLRHELVVEGTERVAVIVRDAVTGTEIARLPRTRNLDYTIRYGEGRVVFSEPIPAFTDMAFTANHNLGQVRAGHRVFVEVEYDHEDSEPFTGVGAGLHASQLMFGHLELGGGYVYEGREDGNPGYQLGGVHARLFLDDVTFVKAEWAWSQSVDAGNFLSLDGGLTYGSLGQKLDEGPVRVGRVVFPANREGHALKLDGQLGFGHFFGRASSDGLVRAYVQRLSPGFFAGASIVEQGQVKWGGEGFWQITDEDRLRLRYDGVVADIPEIPHISEARTLHREIVTAQYQRRIFDGLTGAAEYGYGYTYDSGTFGSSSFPRSRDYHTNVTALSLDWQALEQLAIGLKQELLLSGDPNQLLAWNDHLISHATLRYQLSEDLALTATESLRWSGENQTSLGVSWRISDEARVYANERFGFARQGFTNTTVVGGETAISDSSRAYAEYQLQSAFSAQQSRGVVGLKNHWKLPFGFALGFGYERTQTLGGNVPVTETGNLPPGAFTDGTFYAAPGANGGGDYFYGAGSRDAVSASVEYQREGLLLASQRLELRYDNFDEDRGGHDRTWLLSMTNAVLRISDELALLARYNIGLAQDLTAARREAYLEEGTLGVAYRPITHDWVSVLSKLSRKVESRPLSLKEGRAEDYTIHAFAVEPIVELPWKLQLAFKLALKHASQQLDDLPRADALTTLWISRLNWHALGTFRSLGVDPVIPGEIDLGVEYRLLAGFTAERFEHGVLLETQYAPVDYFRIGLGWNFTHFSDDELARDDRDYSGFFLRGVGQF